MGPVKDLNRDFRVISGKGGNRFIEFTADVVVQIADGKLQLFILALALCFSLKVFEFLNQFLAVAVKILAGRGQGESPVVPDQ